MRLLNVDSRQFEQFFDEQTPPYAVVSHRWSAREVSFQDYVAGENLDGIGYEKIVKCCAIAKSRGHQFIWIDTCCIDKTSSAELTEAINSMFLWYQKAVECYAILPDLPHTDDKDSMRLALTKSAWFTRGWTLQELLAPRVVYFFDSAFKLFASKVELADTIFELTGIRKKFLADSSFIQSASVAEKMSWMSRRYTTRIEDTAYCLLGLFGVNMPLLYGEREKAFFRLQLEILRSCDDESIFAWCCKDKTTSGMLASWPSDFAESGSIRRLAIKPEDRVPWSWVSKGLEVRLMEGAMSHRRMYDPMPVGQDKKLVTLGCWRNDNPSEEVDDDHPTRQMLSMKIIGIQLKRFGTAWQRNECDSIQVLSGFDSVNRFSTSNLVLRHYYVPQSMPPRPAEYK